MCLLTTVISWSVHSSQLHIMASRRTKERTKRGSDFARCRKTCLLRKQKQQKTSKATIILELFPQGKVETCRVDINPTLSIDFCTGKPSSLYFGLRLAKSGQMQQKKAQRKNQATSMQEREDSRSRFLPCAGNGLSVVGAM